STLAAIIDLINETRAEHILTIEDPIEFLYLHKKATVHQRELHSDTPTFALALRAALRQAPKVILVGEMRDRETTEIALTAAETGHLVCSTRCATGSSTACSTSTASSRSLRGRASSRPRPRCSSRRMPGISACRSAICSRKKPASSSVSPTARLRRP